MPGGRVPGPIGTDPSALDDGGDEGPGAGFGPARPIGADEPIPLDVTRTVIRVVRDWDASTPRTTPDIVVHGANLAAVAVELDKLNEWGEGGGRLRTDRIPPGNTPELTVTLHANLVMRMPRWVEYAQASPAARTEWDRMVAKLRAHERRHVDIAVEEADALATALIGASVDDIAQMVTDANQRMQGRQNDLDTATDHGAKPNVQYGGVILDTSIA